MPFSKILSKLNLSGHDVLVILVLYETLWWGMFAFMDTADVVLRALIETVRIEYHLFLLVQKIVSIIKLIAVVVCLWYGAIILGKSLFPRIYLLLGVFIDLMLLLAWIFIANEENWPLGPSNIYGIHYIITFIIIRSFLYYIFYRSMGEIFIPTMGPPVVGTVNGNGTVTGIPEQGNNRTLNSSDHLAFMGKGLRPALEYYRRDPEKACLVAILWDLWWNTAVIISQELPEVAFNYVIVGILGSLPLNFSVEDFSLRIFRVLLGVVMVYIVVKKKTEIYVKIWTCVYLIVICVNAVILCIVASTSMFEETGLATAVFCLSFFGSMLAKLFVLYCVARYYIHLKKGNIALVNENNNTTEQTNDN